MTRIAALLAWLDGKQHEARFGHSPAYYDIGSGLRVGELYRDKVCVECLKGGHRPPRVSPLFG